MKSFLVSLAFISFAQSALATQITATCTRTKDASLDDETFKVVLDEKNVTADSENYRFVGKFMRIAKNGQYMYDSPDVTDIGDQTDYGRIFVSPELIKGKNGTINFSARQLGDSEGAWWIENIYNCKVSK